MLHRETAAEWQRALDSDDVVGVLCEPLGSCVGDHVLVCGVEVALGGGAGVESRAGQGRAGQGSAGYSRVESRAGQGRAGQGTAR